MQGWGGGRERVCLAWGAGGYVYWEANYPQSVYMDGVCRIVTDPAPQQ